MKKSFIAVSMCLLLSTPFYSQTGIGTATPTATLDIQSKTSIATDKALEINSSSGTEILTVFNNGNLEFKGALMPNNDPGTAGLFLISKGLNVAPQWSVLPIPVGSKQIHEVFEIISTGNATNMPANTWKRIPLSTINLPNDSNVGSWNAAAYEYTASVSGLYTITAGVSMYTNSAEPFPIGSGKMRIYTGSTFFEYTSVTIQCGSCSPITYWDNVNGETVVKLNAGDKIWLETQTNQSWVLDNAFFHIKYAQ